MAGRVVGHSDPARRHRLPRGRHNSQAGTLGQDEYDYGMFDFVQAFSDAVANAVEVARTQGKDAAIVPVVDALSCKQCHDDYRSE